MPLDGSVTRLCLICGADISALHGIAKSCEGDCRRKLKNFREIQFRNRNIDRVRAQQNARRAKNREKYNERGRVWHQNHKTEAPAKNRKRLYRDAVNVNAPDKCDVCGMGGRINYDHDHVVGHFRGWLCSNCNHALGHAKDDPKVLRALAEYLERNGHG